jgi:trehalose-6-phosphate synthase
MKSAELQRFAGAADQLPNGAVLINPYDIEKAGEAICRAFCMSSNCESGGCTAPSKNS